MKPIRKSGQPLTKALLEELAIKDGSGCWLWPRSVVSAGYGVLRIGKRPGKLLYLHRLAWELWCGPIPDSLFVLHRCDVPRCFNPDHLFLGTHADNMRDASNKGRMRRGESHADAILNAEQVMEIRRRYCDGERKRDLALAFGISRQGIYSIVERHNWKHLP